MKATLFDSTGTKQGTIDLPKIFATPVREDIIAKTFEAEKHWHPYAPNRYAGKRASASGTISHRRHTWGGHYGQGISRAPRKTMRRRGTRFYWIGATVSGARGGRQAHPPKGTRKERKINKKEKTLAIYGALAATTNPTFIQQRYETIEKEATEHIPAVIESLPQKTKLIREALKKIFTHNKHIVFKRKSIRSGKGKVRSRKYKANQGILIITAQPEKRSIKGFDFTTLKELKLEYLYPLGRLTLFTKKALEELNNVP